jgi:hypothetical protein
MSRRNQLAIRNQCFGIDQDDDQESKRRTQIKTEHLRYKVRFSKMFSRFHWIPFLTSKSGVLL